MSIAIKGMGWVTPLGCGLEPVWERLMAGERGEVKQTFNPEGNKAHSYMPVPPKQVESIGRMPRLRRSSAISYFTTAAGLAAMENAGLAMTPELAARTAVVFAISSGGVVYSRRFYETIVAKGANAASPLLFPETVFNAPASHAAALLGIDGASYTIVGDASAGVSAVEQAAQLIEGGDADYCVVIGGEEVDWVLCEAYRAWRLTAGQPPSGMPGLPPKGMLLAEGAGALLLAREGETRIERIHSGTPFFKRNEAASAARSACLDLANAGQVDLIVASANGTFVDQAEATAVAEAFPGVPVTYPKAAFGEALGASALLQTIVAALALQKNEAPGLSGEARERETFRKVAVPVIGLNQQAAGLILSR